MMSSADERCGDHEGLDAELRALARAALDRVTPVLDRVRSAPAGEAEASTQPCAVCPVCAVVAALRGERVELAVRLAEHLSGLLAVLRSALDEGSGDPEPAPDPSPPSEPERRVVQRIPVARTGPRR
jgi:hypothetical protein